MPKRMLINCPNCNFEGPIKKIIRGNFRMEVILWCLVIIPGLIYSFWRLSGGKEYICPQCTYNHVIRKGMIKVETSKTIKILRFIIIIILLFLLGGVSTRAIFTKQNKSENKTFVIILSTCSFLLGGFLIYRKTKNPRK